MISCGKTGKYGKRRRVLWVCKLSLNGPATTLTNPPSPSPGFENSIAALPSF